VQTAFAYALGRTGDGAEDQAAIDNLTAELTKKGTHLKDALLMVASSDSFQQRRGAQP
jgi:hypothetical protein